MASSWFSRGSDATGAKVVDKSKRTQKPYFGGMASAGAALCTHPLDLLKVHLQTQQEAKLSLPQMAGKVVKTEGVRGLYNGISASLLRQATYSTARFALYDYCKKTFKGEELPDRVLYAAVSGAFGGIIGTPGDLVNVRMQNDMKLPVEQRRNYKHALDGVFKIYKHEGVRTLFNGVEMATFRAALMTVGQLAFYDTFKGALVAMGWREDSSLTHFFGSFGAASVATVLTQPMDVLKTRMMNAAPGEFKGIIDCAKYTKAAGWGAFYKGFFPAWIRLAPHTILTFLFLEQLTMNFGNDPKE